MKLNFKMMAIAAALASLAGASQAALISGATSNSSLALVAYNTTNSNWYIRDLGYLLNSFLPTGVTTQLGDGNGVVGDKSPTAGLTINSTGSGGATVNANFADAAFGTWFTAQGATRQADVVWMVGAYDGTSLSSGSSQRRMVVSSTNAAETTLNTNLDSFYTTARFGGLGNGSMSPFGTATLSQSGLGTDSTLPVGDNGDFASGVSLGAVGQAQNLFYVVRSAYTGATGSTNFANTTAFGNATGLATITLGSDGEVVYSLAGPEVSAVPVPAAAWLLGSGLVALGGAARRRRAAAAQA